MDQPEAFFVAEAPFVIVEQRPGKIALHRRAARDGLADLGKMVVEIGDALNNFKTPQASLNPKFSIRLRGPIIWNKFLTEYHKTTNSSSKFKNLIKLKLLYSEKELEFY